MLFYACDAACVPGHRICWSPHSTLTGGLAGDFIFHRNAACSGQHHWVHMESQNALLWTLGSEPLPVGLSSLLQARHVVTEQDPDIQMPNCLMLIWCYHTVTNYTFYVIFQVFLVHFLIIVQINLIKLTQQTKIRSNEIFSMLFTSYESVISECSDMNIFKCSYMNVKRTFHLIIFQTF